MSSRLQVDMIDVNCPMEEKIDVLLNKEHHRYFRYNIDEFCKVLASLIDQVKSKQEFVEIVQNESIFRKTLIESQDFYLHFINILLLPIIRATAKLDVLEDASKIVKKCIFTKQWAIFEQYLTENEENDDASQNVCKTLANFLIPLYPLTQNECQTGCQLVFEAFRLACTKFDVTYKFYLILLELIGFDLAFNTLRYVVVVPKFDLNKSLGIANQLVEIIGKCKIHNDCTFNELKFGEFHRNLAASIMSWGPHPTTCLILSKMVENDPLLAEVLLEEIITCFIIKNDASALKEYEEVMVKIMEIYRKLQGIQHFIAKVIPILKIGFNSQIESKCIYKFKGDVFTYRVDKTMCKVDLVLSTAIFKCFSDCVTTLASWKLVNLFKTLLHHFSVLVNELAAENDTAKPNFILIEIVSLLTSWFLSSARMFENSIAFHTIQKLVDGLEQLRNILGQFGQVLLRREHDQLLMKSFLTVCYNWGEVYITFSYYANTEDIKLKIAVTNDYSACNFSFVHSYLTEKEWCMISERISNFSQAPCKNLVLQLIIQKFKASLMLEHTIPPEMLAPVIQYLCLNINDLSVDILLKDDYIMSNLLPKMPTQNLLDLCKVILRHLLENHLNLREFLSKYDSQLLVTRGILHNIFINLNGLLVQKRKLGEDTVKKSILTEISAKFTWDLFLGELDAVMLKRAVEILCLDSNHTLDIKIQDEQIAKYIDILANMPLIFCCPETRKCLLVMLLALHKDCSRNECDQAVGKIETLLIGIEQHSRFDLLELFKPKDLLKLVLRLNRYEELFEIVIQHIFKAESSAKEFRTGIDYLLSNLASEKRLKCTIALVNHFKNAKRNQSQVCRAICSEYSEMICKKFIEFSGENLADHLVEPFALALRYFFWKNEHCDIESLEPPMQKYIKYCLDNLNGDNMKGALVLFATILNRNKSHCRLEDKIETKIWNALKNCPLVELDKEECVQIIVFIVTHIEKEEMVNMLKDLEDNVTRSLEKENDQELFKYLKIWKCVYDTSLNHDKTEIIQDCLQRLVERLSSFFEKNEFNKVFLEEVVNFEVAIIQKNIFPITFVMVDLFIFTVTILMRRKANFFTTYNLSMSLMENLLKYRKALILDRLPTYLLQYKFLVKALCIQSNSDVNRSREELKSIADYAYNLETLTKNLVACQKDLSRIAYYMIEDILIQYESITLYPSVKLHLDNCIYSLISVCDNHAVQYLLRILTEASTAIFKYMYENYKKHHRFTGKI